MYKIVYNKWARLDLKKLDVNTAKRIIEKVEFYAQQESPLDFAKQLHGFIPIRYRFRIGDYRVIFMLDNENLEINILVILRIKHRKDIYRLEQTGSRRRN